jgi:ABC-type oligopeptide transport system substrate-binding subunit
MKYAGVFFVMLSCIFLAGLAHAEEEKSSAADGKETTVVVAQNDSATQPQETEKESQSARPAGGIDERLIRPTERGQDRGKKVAAFWFIETR